MLSYTLEPKIIVIVILVFFVVISICYLFKDQIAELLIHIRKTNILHAKLKKFCKNHDYILLTNLILPTEDGKRIKVDDLILADKYIYVISQRILFGNISGVDNDAKWIVRSNKQSKYFSNPFNSNEIRLNTISKLTNVSVNNFINLVCFSKTAFIKDIKINGLNKILTNTEKIEKAIIRNEKDSPYNDFLPEEVEKIANFLYQKSRTTLKQ